MSEGLLEGERNVYSSFQPVRRVSVCEISYRSAVQTNMLTLTRESHGASPVCE